MYLTYFRAHCADLKDASCIVGEVVMLQTSIIEYCAINDGGAKGSAASHTLHVQLI